MVAGETVTATAIATAAGTDSAGPAVASSSHHSNSNSNSNTNNTHTNTLDAESEHSDEELVVNSIRLQYPKSSRLLLGTTTNIQQPGFLKALETRYPLELSLECFDLQAPPRLLPSLSMRNRTDRQWLLRPFAIFFYRNGGDPDAPWERIGRTETILYDDYHRFVTKLKVCCATPEDRRKELRVEIHDRRTKSDDMNEKNFIGAAECSLDDIISEPLLRKEMRLESIRVAEPGRIVISADAIRPCVDAHKMSLSVTLDARNSKSKGQHRAFFVLSRQLQSGDYTAVYRSEILALGREEKKFRAVVRDVAAITAGVDDKLLRLEVFQYNGRGPHIRLGFMQTSIDKLKRSPDGSRLLWWPCAFSEDGDLIDVGRAVLKHSSQQDGHLEFRLAVTKSRM